MRRPKPGEYAPYYEGYVSRTRGANHLQNLRDSADYLVHFLENLPAEKWDFAYASGKWTVSQMIQHIIDCDMVFIYRALWIARTGSGILPGMDQDQWVESASKSQRKPQELMDEFIALRNYIVSTFKSFAEADLEKAGNASDKDVVVNSIAYIIAGHTFHHLAILKERYV